MESSYVPPEVAAQYANQSDQPSDEEQGSQNTQQNQATDDSSGPSVPQTGVPGLSGSDPVGQQSDSGDMGSSSGTAAQETLTLKQQLQLLSPMGILRALAGDVFGETTEQQKQAEQEALWRQQQLQQQEQQRWQAEQQRQQAEETQLTQQVDTLKMQGRSLAGQKSSVLFSHTTQGDQSELTLTEQAVKDAQHQAAQRRHGGLADPGSHAKQGPSSLGDLAQQKSGMQKASEISMGE